ncbi:transposase family protein [Streptomyces sp. NPDC089799]|uniref:transposase family protein n=1 Tax=Streptomyces sp. NPDC089799 TaxID=3155066 RepID=UPI003421DAF0
MLELVFPHLVTVLVERVVVESSVLRIAASTKDGTAAACPGCGTSSRRVHSRYGRRIADAPVAARPVLIELSVRRLFCDNSGCARVTFAEQVEGLTSRYGRRTPCSGSSELSVSSWPLAPWSGWVWCWASRSAG